MQSLAWDSSPTSGGYLMAQEQFETQRGENKILRQKLESKSEALVILTKELEKLRAECEDYKELARRLQSRSQIPGGDSFSYNSRTFRDHVIANHFSDLRDENQRLLSERDNIRRILSDREEDVRLLRAQLIKEKSFKDEGTAIASFDHERNESNSDDLVKQLEKLQIKCTSLRQDLQSLLDEKEDLFHERDAYKSKVHRLNHSMAALLKSNTYKLVDIDSLLSENRYLRESLDQVREEKKLANEMGIRYKNALEKSKPATTSAVKENTSYNSGAGMSNSTIDKIVLLINRTSFPCPQNLDLNRQESLQELCLNLLETLNDRMLQLKHQRKANKHILDRLNQLESKILAKNKDIGELILRPSQHLMKDYSQFNQNEDIFDSSTTTPSTEGCDDEAEDSSLASNLAECQKIIASLSSNASVSQPLNPPDIIANEVHRPACAPLVEDKDSDLLSEPIVLPDHLQRLVDEAMKDILCQSQE